MNNSLQSLPSVDRLMRTESATSWIERFGRSMTLDAVRTILEDVRTHYAKAQTIPNEETLQNQVENRLKMWNRPTLQPVINATGVVLHTNLGRAPLSAASVQAIHEAASGYTNLEFDLEKGKRGSRLVHAEALICRLTGAQAAMVVNNNAAAILLALSVVARRRSVVISRTQLVEVGGGFRIPEVMKQSGARLLEIGTTNRVHMADYELALEENPAAFFHAHRSNFRMIGFTDEPELSEIAALAHKAGILFIDDQGSGVLLDTTRYGLGHEPTVQESLAAGADLVCFSGDKLLGGPQAGILAGRADLISRVKKHPLARAIRADKLCLAGLSATLLHYLRDEAEREIPIWRMISATVDAIDARCRTWRQILGYGEIISGESTVGGGSLPGETLPTRLLALSIDRPERFVEKLRLSQPAVITRILEDRVIFDPRSVLPEQDTILIDLVKRLIP